MPRVDDIIDQLCRAKYFPLDLTKGYWQVPVKATDRPKTAFSTPFGLYQFTVMPFGLHFALCTFQHLINKVVHGVEDYNYVESFVESYVDVTVQITIYTCLFIILNLEGSK